MASQALDTVSKNILVNKDQRKQEKKIITEFVRECFVGLMRRESPLFAALFVEVSHVGSAYERMRVNGGDYDLDLMLGVAAVAGDDDLLAFAPESCRPGFLRVQPLSNPCHWTGLSADLRDVLLEKLPDGDWIVSAGKVNRWMEGVVQKAWNKLPDYKLGQYGIDQMRMIKHGPAKTLDIKMRSGHRFEVDLVPAMDFAMTDLLDHPTIGPRIPAKYRNDDWTFRLVPKSDQDWKVSLALVEKDLLKGYKNLKPVVRLIKAFRKSNPPLDSLTSRCLKTVMMHHREKFGIMNSSLVLTLPGLFLLALELLHDFIHPDNGRGIPNYWDGGDEIRNLKRATRENNCNQVRKAKACLENNMFDLDEWMRHFGEYGSVDYEVNTSLAMGMARFTLV